MNTNRLSHILTKALNQQITNEAHNAQIYLSYAAWAPDPGPEPTSVNNCFEKATDSALYSFNKDLGTTPDEAVLAQHVTVEKP